MAQGYAQLPYTGMLPANRSRPGAIMYLRSASLAVWLLALLVPFLLIKNWDSQIELAEEGVDFKKYFYVGFAVICFAHLTLGVTAWLAAPFKILKTMAGIMLTVFLFIELMVSPLSIVPATSALYSVATWGVILVCTLYWQSDFKVAQRTTYLAGMGVILWLYFLCAKLGVHHYQIGGINRNVTGLAAVGGIVCCMVYPRKELRWAAVGMGLLIALLCTSRGSLFALAAFGIAYYTAYKGTYRAVVHGLIAAVILGGILLAIPSLRHAISDDVFQLHNKDRGIGSGFTGRMDLWKQAITAFWKNPILGYGFRASTHGHGEYGAIHSGYLKILVETGFVGGFLVIGAVVSEAVRRLRLVLQLRSTSPAPMPGIDVAESIRLNAVVFGTMGLTLALWIYEQLYINLGSVICVALFLMLTAPAYVPLQPKELKR